MLTEHFIASISTPSKPNTGVTKDAGIFLYEFQPLASQRSVFKKSATSSNCLAVSTSHIFAAQVEKAVVHVYNREKGNQEAIVPFPERIHSIALASGDTVLLLGTESGRILVWETCTGRLVSTPTSHLQQVTTLAVDPSSNFFLSGSTDSIIHVWSLPNLLSFSPDASHTPIHTLSTHRGLITALVTGHNASSASIAISASQDNSAIVWDYRNGKVLRTYLLEATPLALALDPADRAFYASYEDGSIQTIDLFDAAQRESAVNNLHDSSLSNRPIQPPTRTRFNASSQNLGSAATLSLSWDGTTLLSGHSSGKIASWDISKGGYVSTLANLPGPVMNLHFLPPTGFPGTPTPKFKIPTIVKPRHNASPTSIGAVDSTGTAPGNYALNVQLTSRIRLPSISASSIPVANPSEFETALTHPSFPSSLLDDGLAELAAWSAQPPNGASAPVSADYLSLAPTPQNGTSSLSHADGNILESSHESQLQELRAQVASLQRVQKVTFKQLAELREERGWWVEKEERRERRRLRRKARRREEAGLVEGGSGKEGNAVRDEDEKMDDGEESEEVDSSDDDDYGDLDRSSGGDESGLE
ncbi:WD40 repeat-like protein [Glonium stellatum]|uniref:Pre-rRNA-processing protein IPI3 n=1 Tax=Glonium stellatum TaxID=574774 RepID=A0A8E2JMF0_9PEZI|nr:WD40 repeat-like protein [Glonium stellatum]